MPPVRRLRSLLLGWFERRRLESEMDEEIRFHHERRAADLVAAGSSRAEAERPFSPTVSGGSGSAATQDSSGGS